MKPVNALKSSNRLQKPKDSVTKPQHHTQTPKTMSSQSPNQDWPPVTAKEIEAEVDDTKLYLQAVINTSPTLSALAATPSLPRAPKFAFLEPPFEKLEALSSSLESIMKQASQMLNHLVQLISSVITIVSILSQLTNKTHMNTPIFYPHLPEYSFSLIKLTKKFLIQSRKHPDIEILSHESSPSDGSAE